MEKLSDQFELIPPFCPNSRCDFHKGTDLRFYVKNGFVPTHKAPFFNQRYRCKRCKIQFSSNTFKIDFRKKIISLSEPIVHYSMNGMSNNSIARRLKVSETSVRNRLRTVAHQALLFEKQNRPPRLIEDVAYDGFETFTHSQYSPCYINTAVGKKSHFIYHNTFSPLNRKGRMSEEQKIKNLELIKKYGAYPRDSIFEESCYIMSELSRIGADKQLFSDEHKSYARAYRAINCKLLHKAISSKQRRDPSNPLFPINHLHQAYRHFCHLNIARRSRFKSMRRHCLRKFR